MWKLSQVIIGVPEQCKTPEMEIPEMETPEMETPEMEIPELETPEMETGYTSTKEVLQVCLCAVVMSHRAGLFNRYN